MNRVYFLLVITLFLIILGCGCGGSNTGTPSNAWDSYFYDPGSISDNCCGVTYTGWISGNAPEEGLFYYLSVVDSDTLLVYGSPEYIQDNTFDSIPLSVNISYLDNIAEGNYQLQVLTCDSMSFVGKIEKRVLGNDVTLLNIVSYADSICEPCCSPGKFRAVAIKTVEDVREVEADIQTRYGKFCPDISKYSHYAAWVSITKEFPKKLWWGQCGYADRRYPYDTASFKNVYLEVKTDGDNYEVRPQETIPAPSDYSMNNYKLILSSFYSFQLYYNGDFKDTYTDEYWIDSTSTHVSWGGEVEKRETDMPGTLINPCKFENCRFTKNGLSSQPAQFNNQDHIGVTAEKTDEWTILYLDGHSWLEVIDKVKLP